MDTASVLGVWVGLVEAACQHLFGVVDRDLQRLDDQAAVFAEQGASAIHLGGGDPAGGVAQAVFQPGQDLALLGDLAPQAAGGDLQAAHRRALMLVVVIQGPAPLGLQRLDLLRASADLLLQGLTLGVGDEAVLGFPVRSVLHDLVDSIMLGEELEAVLLPPAPAQAVNDLGGSRGRSQGGEHGDRRPLVAEEQNGAQGTDPPQAGLLLEQPVGVAVVLEREPARPKLFPPITAAGAAAPEIGDESDVLLLQEAEGIAAVAASVEDQGEGLRAVRPADLLHRGGEGAGQGVVEGLGEEEQHPSPASWR